MTELAQALDSLARRRLSGDAATGLARMTAGATQEIWRFNLVKGGAETPLILRRAPGGDRVSESATGLEVEAALMEAAEAAGVPVPSVKWVLTPEDGIGHGFVMAFVEGETLGGRIARGEAFAEARKVLTRQCGAALAAIHRIDPAAFPTLKRVSPLEFVTQYRGPASWRSNGWSPGRPRPCRGKGAWTGRNGCWSGRRRQRTGGVRSWRRGGIRCRSTGRTSGRPASNMWYGRDDASCWGELG